MSELVIRTARETLLTALTGDPVTRAEAERLVGLHDAQRSADTAARLLAERDRHATRDFRDGIEHAARRVAEYGAEGHAVIAAAEAAVPDFFQASHGVTDTNRRARLLHAMALGARWKSGDVVAWYQTQGLIGLGTRAARHDLAVLRDSGAITQHDEKGVRFYTLATHNTNTGNPA